MSWTTDAWSATNVTGTIPIAQRLHLPDPSPPKPLSSAAEGATGLLGDDFEAQVGQLTRRLQAVQLVVDAKTDILALAPRTADHYALGPYRSAQDVELVASELRFGGTRLTDLRADARLEEGVLRIDRFQAGLWEGDLLFDVALQVTPKLDVKTRASGHDDRPQSRHSLRPGQRHRCGDRPRGKDRLSGQRNHGLRVWSQSASPRGQIDVVRLSKPLVDACSGRSTHREKARRPKPSAIRRSPRFDRWRRKIWIAQNLLNVQFEWERVLGFDDPAPWWVVLDALLFAPRLVSALCWGRLGHPTVNNTVKRASVFNFLNPYIGATLDKT